MTIFNSLARIFRVHNSLARIFRIPPPSPSRKGTLKFHGRFADKAMAVAKEKRTRGAFIIEKEIRGETYYVVATKK